MKVSFYVVSLSLSMIKTSFNILLIKNYLLLIGLYFSVGDCNEYSTIETKPQTSNLPDLQTTQETRTTQPSLRINTGKFEFRSDPRL